MKWKTWDSSSVNQTLIPTLLIITYMLVALGTTQGKLWRSRKASQGGDFYAAF